MSGLRFGLVAGVCWLMPYNLVLFGAYKFPYVALPFYFAWALVEQGIGGLVIGLSMGNHPHRGLTFSSSGRGGIAVRSLVGWWPRRSTTCYGYYSPG